MPRSAWALRKSPRAPTRQRHPAWLRRAVATAEAGASKQAASGSSYCYIFVWRHRARSQLLTTAVALAVLLTPLAGVLPFIDPGLAKNADCASLLTEAQQKGAPVKASAVKAARAQGAKQAKH